MTARPLGERPGKIIAVHLNYRSRAEQRGRVPQHPSYFLKPASSLGQSGGMVERPAGTELLAFEGEVAIIIGTSARRISPDAAREVIAGVTAANDFGLYDLRTADKGSNLRSKGGDGYTPLGPNVIDASSVDLAELRVRTWVNGDLVQEDHTSTLLFPFEQLVADLSQMLTLEAGDVILTGTPAGSSVVQPGDTVEVEVDAPSAPGNPSSGRLVTHVTQGHVPFADFGEKPSMDDRQRREAWGSTPPEEENIPEPDWAGLTADVGTAALSAELRRRGYVDVFLDGVTPLKPGVKMAGRARTLRMIAFRPDLFASHGGGYNAQKRAFDSLGPGDVLVVEARRDSTAGTVGDILALRAQWLGAAGIVTDGCVRDSGFLSTFELPVFAQGGHPSVLGRRHVPWETDVTVTCGGAAVQPGDLVVGDTDGVIVIPSAIADEVVAAASAQEAEDAYIARQVTNGAKVDGLFPMNAEWRARFEADADPT
ncbi:fumarylacetoacetate hydrolase family protein [Streptomyces sp. NPDC057474]|uniref:fumarylacetoacetate hydrolase family protein n=1 Tax=Streptomyces sp. NPDC057474 TaxID=3346144 RepID=UPI0036761872